MKANSDKSKQSNKATRRVLAGVLCGASVLSLVLSLVMPPISQAIANDGQTVSTEESDADGATGVDGTNVNGENQKSDEVEGGEADPSNGVGQGQSEDQPEGELQVEDGESSDDGAVMAAAEGGQTETASEEIKSVSDLKTKLENASGVASFILMNDVETSETITLKDGSNITLDLNGCKIKHTSKDQSLFNITGGAALTVKDSQRAAAKEIEANRGNKYGNLASMEYDDASNIPTSLTYYVTESTASGTGTTETLKAYKADIKGAIVACSGSENLRLITISNGGHFNLESGVITQGKDRNVKNLVYANNSTVNMNGGYVCGGYCPDHAAGAGISVENSTTLGISGGVIAGNSAPSGGGVYANGSTVTMSGGIISGNSTLANMPGYGGGIMGEGSSITVSGGYVTNNAYQYNYMNYTQNIIDKHKGNGCHGGGGIAALSSGEGQKNGSLAINGGYITGNYSAEAGGGVYAGAWNRALDNFTFSGGTVASNVAQNSEGGGIRIGAPTKGEFSVPLGTKAYITNNTTNTTNDWGGGGVFVQGSSDQGSKSASLNIYNALITNNHANGFGGGFAACPTGKTAITDTNGIAIFGNSDGKPDGSGYNRSGGTHEKTDDKDWRPNHAGGEITEDFKIAGHQDLFLIRDSANAELLPYIAAVTGQMLGGGAANWSGTIDNAPITSIGKYEGAQAKYMIGLKSEPIQEDKDAATTAATLYITGNKSNIHGGGIMTNGDVVAGSTTQVSVYPKMKLNGTKALTGRVLKNGEFKFQLLKQGTNKQGPSFADHKLQLNGCTKVGDGVTNDGDGKFAFNLGEVYSDDSIVYYLVEDPGDNPVSGVTCDETIYKIDPKVVKDEHKSHKVLDIEYTYYTVGSVQITTIAANGVASDATVYPTPEGDVASVALTSSKTFTNTYTKYDSKGSWTPMATKVVKGGEMKEFTLEFADNENFKGNSVRTVKTDAAGDTTQPLSFLNASGEGIKYSLSDITKDPYTAGDSTGRGASKTFTYYVRERTDGALFSNYKYDKSVYKLDVTMTDQKDGKITATKVTYTKIKDAEGEPIDEAVPVDYNDGSDNTKPVSIPTFTNTYSTSLPLSGMSGVTLTYLAGAAVLCAAAAWMHVRRKANAKGGERRE